VQVSPSAVLPDGRRTPRRALLKADALVSLLGVGVGRGGGGGRLRPAHGRAFTGVWWCCEWVVCSALGDRKVAWRTHGSSWSAREASSRERARAGRGVVQYRGFKPGPGADVALGRARVVVPLSRRTTISRVESAVWRWRVSAAASAQGVVAMAAFWTSAPPISISRIGLTPPRSPMWAKVSTGHRVLGVLGSFFRPPVAL